MTDKRLHRRSLCADLVTLEWISAKRQTETTAAVLEDISTRGACLQTERAVPENTSVILHLGEESLGCQTAYCHYREIGYFVGLEFAEGFAWSQSLYRPDHLFDVRDLLQK